MRLYEDLLDDIEAKKTDMSAVDADEIKNSPDDYEYIFCFSCLALEELKNPEYFVDRLSDILSANRFVESSSEEGISPIFESYYSLVMELQQQSIDIGRNEYAMR